MDSIILKKHFLKFYLAIASAVLFTLAMSALMFHLYITEHHQKPNQENGYYLILLSVVLLVLGVYCGTAYIKNTPTVTVTPKNISYRGIIYSIENISNITFTGNQPFMKSINFDLEGMCIQFKDKKVLYLYDRLYSNMPHFKQFIQMLHTGNFPGIVTIIPKSIVNGEHLYFYKGSFIFSLRGITFLLFTLLWFAILLKNETLFSNIAAVGLLAGTYSLIGYVSNYFAMNEKYFVIKNYLFFWRATGFNLLDIKEVCRETHSKAPTGLRLITNDYNSFYYPAASLSEKKWKELEIELEKHNIKVRNEIL